MRRRPSANRSAVARRVALPPAVAARAPPIPRVPPVPSIQQRAIERRDLWRRRGHAATRRALTRGGRCVRAIGGRCAPATLRAIRSPGGQG
eukprot:6495347-Prymnesium_polylepis.1